MKILNHVCSLSRLARPILIAPVFGSFLFSLSGLHALNTWDKPFNATSIWNRKIGQNAVLVDAKLGNEGSVSPDREHLVTTTSSDPYVDVRTPGSWTNRCPGNYASWQGKCYVPSGFTVADANPPSTPNACTAILQPDGVTIVSIAPACRDTGSGPVIGYRFDDTQLDGGGRAGSHGASRLSTLGGSIRVGEMLNGIDHAVKVNLWCEKYVYYNSATGGYRWPAYSADSYASTVYGGTVSALRMGALLTFQDNATYSSIGGLVTDEAKNLFDAIYLYGAYVPDDTAWSNHGFCVEVGAHFPSGNANFKADINKIMKALYVVDDNNSTSAGAGPARVLGGGGSSSSSSSSGYASQNTQLKKKFGKAGKWHSARVGK